MNKKLNFVWQNIDQPFCKEFKAQIDTFSSVRQAYIAATLINQRQNADYNSSKSTSIGHKSRTKANPTSLASQATSLSSLTSQAASGQDLLNKFKEETRTEIKSSLDKITSLCKMKKEQLLRTINDETGEESYSWARELLGDKIKDITKASLDTLLICNLLASFHGLIDNVSCDK